MKLDPEYIDDGNSFVRISPQSLRPEHFADFSIFARYELGEEDKKRHIHRCLLVEGQAISAARLMEILRSWDAVYIHKAQRPDFKKYVRENLDFILNNEKIDVETRAKTLASLSSEVVKDAFRVNFGARGVDKHTFANVKNLIAQAVDFISSINSLDGLAKLVGHDYDTHTHSIKVGWLTAVFINANQDLFDIRSRERLNQLLTETTVAGFLHDLGKVKVPRNVLNKRGRLNNLELVMVQSHTAYSLTMLFDTDLAHNLMQAILYHHENEDGSGYPCGIKGDEIPLLAKITHIADVFDALTSRRPYKKAKTPFEALKVMTGLNPHVQALNMLEKEVRENLKAPIYAQVREGGNAAEVREKERRMVRDEEMKRIETRTALRDMGMAHCFDQEILIRFINTLNQSDSFDLNSVDKKSR